MEKWRRSLCEMENGGERGKKRKVKKVKNGEEGKKKGRNRVGRKEK